MLTLKLGESRYVRFRRLMSSLHRITEALNYLRNKEASVNFGNGRDLKRLAVYQRRTFVFPVDAFVVFLYKAFLDSQLDPNTLCESMEWFTVGNALLRAPAPVV